MKGNAAGDTRQEEGEKMPGHRMGLLIVLAAAAALPGASTGGAADDGRVSVVHELGFADPAGAYELVQGVLSPEGRAVVDEGHNSLVVLDRPDRQEAVRQVLSTLQRPVPNLRIETRIVDRETGEEVLVDASGQLIIRSPRRRSGASVYFEAHQKKSEKNRTSRQFIVVASGGEASISLGKEIPYQDWLFTYGRRHGIIAGETVWRQVGSRLSVRPRAIDEGRAVRLNVVPEFEYTLGGGGNKKKNPRMKTILFTAAATELVVPMGEEVLIGGSEEQNDFYSRLLVGYDRQRRVRRVDIYLRATIEEFGKGE
jgi:type II secretory pathway component GspD/PulD (secretin)